MATAVVAHPCLSGPDLGSVVLADGEEFKMRFGKPSDRGALLNSFERLSARSRYMRFFSPMPTLSDSMADYLSDVDTTDKVAVVSYPADDPSNLVGVVRYYRSTERSDEAEVALTVQDSHQGRGLGGVMYDRCAAVARANGINTFTATILGENRAMIKFFANRGAELQRDEDDATAVIARIRLD
jgi:GNAT superfamily N-acetyltransferase